MSRFWAGANSSDSDSDEASSEDDSSSMDSGPTGAGGGGGGGGNRWVEMSDSESSDDQVRVVKSGKERALETFQSHIGNLRTYMKERDYYAIQTEFDALSKAMIKAKQYLRAGVPRPLVKILVQLEDYNAERLRDKAQFKTLSARQGRALNKMKLTLKKHNKAYQVVMDAYRQNPDADEDDDDDDDTHKGKAHKGGKGDDDSDDDSDDSDDSSDDSSSSSDDSDSDDSDSDDDSDDKAKNKATKTKAKKADKDSDDDDVDDDDDDDDDSEDWGSGDSDSDSDSEDEGGLSELKGRAKWLKKNTVTKEKDKDKDKEGRAVKRQEQRAKQAAQRAQEAQSATKSIVPQEGLTPALLNRKVRELAQQRGRKGKDPRQMLHELEALHRLAVTFGPRIEVPILMQVISAQFGLQRTLDDYMETAEWKACALYLQRMAVVLVDDGYTLAPADTAATTTTTSGASGATADVADSALASGAASGVPPTAPGGTSAADPKMAAAAAAEGGAMAAVAADAPLVNPHTGEAETPDGRAERLRLEHEATLTDEEKKTISVVGSLSLHLTRLEEEYVKSLQKVSHHSTDYVSRLRDESLLVQLLARFQTYYERCADYATAATLALLRIEHLYYRHDSIATQVDKAALFTQQFGQVHFLHPACIVVTDDDEGNGDKDAGGGGEAPKEYDFTKVHPGSVGGKPTLEESLVTTEFATILSDLCSFVYKHGTEASKTRAMICQICHWAIHNRFADARDLLLMSHLQDTIYSCNDITIMVLYNRMMVNMGLCAFRLGRIQEAHQCLSELCSGRIRELLAQGFNTSRFNNEKLAEQEKAEKRRQVPYHQHINLDLLEACHLISAMLLEVPNMAASAAAAVMDDGNSNRRGPRVISRTFRKFHDQYNHQVFTGPPEQTRDYVMRASKALMKGDWKTCADLVTTLPVWKLVPGPGAADQIAQMLTEKIQVEGLRTYLLAFSAQAYDSLSLPQLCGMFEMSTTAVHSVVSKMMIQRELYASWDQPTQTIVLLRKVVVEPTPLQVLALQYADKAGTLVESNERLLDAQMGGGGGGYNDNDDNANIPNADHSNKRRHWNKDDNRGGGGGGGWHNNRERGGRGGRGGGFGNYRGGGGGGGGNYSRSGDRGGRGDGGGNYNRTGDRGGGGGYRGGDRHTSGGRHYGGGDRRSGGGGNNRGPRRTPKQ